ncbi:MAG: sigma-70 family RNA polymerase sigma factor [Planctomycetaceae bacterium]|nr:sigma-70 family RNA polymerase sigma factor [Planctomycetaceae bacterium]
MASTVSGGAEEMLPDATESELRDLVRPCYQRNRHLTATQDAEDLFQETWIQLHDSCPADPSPTGHSSATDRIRWAVRRVTDRLFGRIRKRCFRGTPVDVSIEFDPEYVPPDRDLVIDLRDQIASLPREEREVMELLRRGHDGLEIARLMDLSPQAVARRKRSAIERLRRRLRR